MSPVDPNLAFRVGNSFALIGWMALAASPSSRRWTPAVWVATGWLLPLALGSAYVTLLLGHWGSGGYGSLAEVRQLFDRLRLHETRCDPGGVTSASSR